MSLLSQFAQTLEHKPVFPQKLTISEIASGCLTIHMAIIIRDVAMYLLPDNTFELAKEGTSQGIEFLNPVEVRDWGSKMTDVLGDDWETHKYSQQRLERKAKQFIDNHHA